MTDQIVTIAHIQHIAQKAYKRGDLITDNPFNWHSPAHLTWHKEFRALLQAEKEVSQRGILRAATQGGIDPAQGRAD